MEVRIDTLPTDISPEEAVSAAYADDLRWIERKLRQGISVLVECDKQLGQVLIPILRDRLREEQSGRALNVTVAGASTRPTQRRRRRRTGDSQETENIEDSAQQRAGIPGMVDDITAAIGALSDDQVLVIPHLDMIATTTRSGLGPLEREVIALLYNNPDAVLLGFKDPEFELPEAVTRVFPGVRQIVGVPRDALRRIVVQREARKFGVDEFDVYSLYKYVSGVNAYRLRQILPLFDDRPDFDPANPSTRDRIFSDIRELTLAGDLEVPRVDLDRDIGGYHDVKAAIRRDVFDLLDARDAAQSPEEVREIDSVLPRGILLEGPPGTGKTFFAKALATKIQAAVIVVSGPELKSQWVGASEQNLRNIFIRARKSAPAIIIFDEIDSFAKSRAESSDAGAGGGVDASMVNTLLTEMDGFKGAPDELVFVVGTTNFAKSLDPALLRPGRFSLVINVPAPSKDDRREILDIYRRKYGVAMADDVLDYLVLKTGGFADPANRRRFSGDDLHAIMGRFRRQAILTPPGERAAVTTAQVDAAVAQATIGGGGSRAETGKVTFDDIGGYEDIKRKIDRDILSIVRKREQETDPERIERLSELIPDAILLEGPAGTGKTFLARAIAGALNAGVIVVNAAEFKSKWYGESQENLREVFAEARKSAPTVIIFDEVDSFAGARGGGDSGYGSRTDDEIVNTLLTEMDGFSPTEQVLVVATTNFAEALDPAVRRRFDYVLRVPPPNEKDRREILALLARKHRIEIPADVFEFMVERTSGIVDRAARRRFSGDDLKEIVKTLRRNQALDGAHPVTMEEAEEAIFQRMVGGGESMGGMAVPEGFRGVRKLTKEEKAEEDRITALHECGHALVAIALKDASWPYKVSIEAPEDAGWAGVTLKEAKEGNVTKAQLLADVASAMGGRVAEEIVLGDLTTGAASDLESATHVARAMVEDLGMSSLGPVAFGGQGSQRRGVSQRFAERIDEEVQKILSEQEERARDVLQKNRKQLDAMVELLVRRRVLDEVDLAKFAADHGWADRVPARLRGLTSNPRASHRDRRPERLDRRDAGWRRCPTSRRDRGGRRAR